MEPLKGTKLVTVAMNVPGPVAAARLVKLGAECVKIEPPSGDPLKSTARAWYASLTENQTVVSLDLKTSDGRRRLHEYLADADLLLTSFRPSALQRLGLGWEELQAKYPRLCVINMVGYLPPQEELPGHDLTYQAKLGLLRPPELPVTLHADLAGAERCVSTALALLMNFAHTGKAERAYVSLYESMRDFTGPLAAGLTAARGILSGSFAFYRLYQTANGWIAVGALEPSFIERMISELQLTSLLRDDPRKELEQVFRTRTAGEWEQWALARDLPIVEVKRIG